MAFTITLRRQDCQRSRSKFVLTTADLSFSRLYKCYAVSKEDALNADKKFLRQTL